MADVKNGKAVLHQITHNIMERNDTEEWDAKRWEDEIGDGLVILRDERYGTSDFNDLLAYMTGDGSDFDMLASILTEGIPYVIADHIEMAKELGEECHFLK